MVMVDGSLDALGLVEGRFIIGPMGCE